MSLGWLTEASILPRKSTPIKASDGGLVNFKAALLSSKEKMTKAPAPPLKPWLRNRPIEQNSEATMPAPTVPQSYQQSYRCLASKQAIYDNLRRKEQCHGSLLVDFSNRPEESQKDIFYATKLEEVRKMREELSQQQLFKGAEEQCRERLAWEKQVLDELKSGVTSAKSYVLQSFDQRLSSEEKLAFKEVLNQLHHERAKAELLKRKRLDERSQRIKKLRKLGVISE